MLQPKLSQCLELLLAGPDDPLPSKVASADEPEARAAEGSHQLASVSLMAGASPN